MEGQGLSISLAPEIILHIWGFALRNTHLTFSIICALTLIILVISASRFSVRPSKFQIILEGTYNFFATKVEGTGLTVKKQKALLSIVLTLFILIIISNLFSVTPILGSVFATTSLGEHVDFFKTPTSHFSLTIAFGLFVVVLANAAAFIISPIRYTGNFIKIGPILRARTPGAFAMGLLDIFLGVMDIVSELAKVISISARLFGNIIAGEIISKVMIFLVPFVAPMPFYVLGIFSGVIQALVFALLSMQFIAGSIGNVENGGE